MYFKKVCCAIMTVAIMMPQISMMAVDETTIENDGQKASDTYSQVKENFLNPDMKYAPYEFWFWDQDLNTLGIKPQDMARELSEKGFNPGYAHARPNYAQVYGGGGDYVKPLPAEQWLSTKWFDEFGKTLKQANSDGSYFSFTDEFGWPSLQAGGKVLQQNPDLVGKSLEFSSYDVRAGESIHVPSSFFSVAAKLVSTQNSSYVEYAGDGWGKDSYSKDTSKPTETATLPYNMAAKYVGAGNGASYAVFHPYFILGGSYKVYARWANVGGNASNVVYQINGTMQSNVTKDQSKDINKWNILGTFDFTQGNGATVKVDNNANGKVCIDALMFVNTANEDDCIVIDDLNTSNRNIGYIDSDTLKIIGTQSTAFNWTAPKDGAYRVYAFKLVNQRGYDGSRVNYLDKRLGSTFIDIAYKPYSDLYASLMGKGKAMNGAFSDNEGGYGYKLAWSNDLATTYNQATGKDIKVMMPLMIDRDIQGIDAKARYDWYNVVSDLYSRNFAVPNNYTAERGMYYTMHTWEESLQLQASTVGDYFKLTRNITLPGTDCLTNVAYNPTNFKETMSVAEFDNKRLMTEVMALEGLNLYTPTELKKQANYMSAYGVSHVITHAVKMTRQLAQSVVTPDFYNIDPTWRYMKDYTDYVRRTSYINSNGYNNAKVLLLNPMDSVWALSEGDVADQNYNTFAETGGIPANNAAFGGKVSEINRIYSESIRQLTASRIDHLAADKYYINQMTEQNGTLSRGNYNFKAVIVPPMTVIDTNVAQKLKAFAQNGGYIYYLGDLPTGSIQNGRNDANIRQIMTDLVSLPTVKYIPDLGAALGFDYPYLTSTVKFMDGKFDMLMQYRIIDNRHFIWVANNDSVMHESKLYIPNISGSVSIWNADDGSIKTANAKANNGGIELNASFEPYEGYYIVIDPSENIAVGKDVNYGGVVTNINSGWTAKIETGNKNTTISHDFTSVTSQKIRMVCRKGSFDEPQYVYVNEIEVNNGTNIAGTASVAVSSGSNAQYINDGNNGTAWKNDTAIKYDESQYIELTFTSAKTFNNITVRTTDGKAIRSYRLEYWDGTWWKNLVTFNEAYEPELINAITYPAALTNGSMAVSLTDWKTWGVLDSKFAGFIDYENTFTVPELTGKTYLDLGKVGQIAQVFINGVPIGSKIFAPFVFDVTGKVNTGSNTLKVRVGNAIAQNAGGSVGECGLLGSVSIKNENYQSFDDPFAAKNLILNASVTASSTSAEDRYDANTITDGNNTTALAPPYSWAHVTGDSAPYVLIDFGKNIIFNQVKLYTVDWLPMQDYDVLAGVSGSWQTVAQVRGNKAAIISSSFATIKADKLKINCLKGSPTQPGISRINEVEVYSTPVNLARAATATASATETGYNAANVIDGNDSTALGGTTSWSVNDKNASVTLDFGKDTTFDNVVLYSTQNVSGNDFKIRGYDIQAFIGGTWQTLRQVRANTQLIVNSSFGMVTTSKLRIQCVEGSIAQANIPRINEIKVYNATPNIALTGTATASSTYESYSVSNVNDGNASTQESQTTSWVNGEGDLSPLVQLDFSGKQAFNRIDLYTVDALNLKDFDIQYFVNNQWQTIKQVRDNANSHMSLYFEKCVTDKVRINCISGPINQPGFMRINEIEMYCDRQIPQTAEIIALPPEPLTPVPLPFPEPGLIQNRLPGEAFDASTLQLILTPPKEDVITNINGKDYRTFEFEDSDYGPNTIDAQGVLHPGVGNNATASNGKVLGWWTADCYATFTVTSDKTCTANLAFSYSCQDADTGFTVNINGSYVTINAPKTATWADYSKTVPVAISLKKGMNVIKVKNIPGKASANGDALYISKDITLAQGLIIGDTTYSDGSSELLYIQPNTDVNANASVENNTSNGSTATMVTAIYNGDVLVDCKISFVTLKAGDEGELNNVITTGSAVDGYIIKTFILDSLATMKPLSKSSVLTPKQDILMGSEDFDDQNPNSTFFQAQGTADTKVINNALNISIPGGGWGGFFPIQSINYEYYMLADVTAQYYSTDSAANLVARYSTNQTTNRGLTACANQYNHAATNGDRGKGAVYFILSQGQGMINPGVDHKIKIRLVDKSTAAVTDIAVTIPTEVNFSSKTEIKLQDTIDLITLYAKVGNEYVTVVSVDTLNKKVIDYQNNSTIYTANINTEGTPAFGSHAQKFLVDNVKLYKIIK